MARRCSGFAARCLALSAAALATACGDTPTPLPAPPVAASPEAPRPRAAPPEVQVPPQPAALDVILSGRSIREWIAVTAEGDPASPTCLAARAALRADPDAAVEAILAWGTTHGRDERTTRRDRATSAGLPRLLASIIPDVRDLLVPRVLPLLEGTPDQDEDPAHAGPARAFALDVLLVIADSRGFGPHDPLVAAALARQPLDRTVCDVLASLGSAFAPVAASVLRPLSERPATFPEEWWFGLGGAAPEVAAALLRAGVDATRNVDDAAQRWLLANARRIGPAIPALVTRLGSLDPREDDRELRAVLLILTRSADPSALAAVRELARSTEPTMRKLVCPALAECSMPSAGVAETLAALTADEDDDVRTAAERAQMQFAAVSDAALEAVVARLRSGDPAMRDRTAGLLEELLFETSPRRIWRARDARSLERRLVGGPDAAVRETLVRALPPRSGALSPSGIESLLHDTDARVRDAARALDPRPQGAGESELPVWVSLLAACRWSADSSDPHGDAAFESVLRDFHARGGRIDALLGEIQRGLSDSESEPRDECEAVMRLGLRATPLRESLADALEAAPAGSRADMLLCAFAAAGGDVTARLSAQLTGANARLRDVTSVLRRLPPSAFPAAADALGHSDPRVRAAFALALGWIDGPPDAATRAIQPLLGDPVGYVRWSAAAALLRLDPWPVRVPSDGPSAALPGVAAPSVAAPGDSAAMASAPPRDLALASVVRELDAWPFPQRLPGDWDDCMAWDCLGELLLAVADAGPEAAPAFEVLHRGLRSPVTHASHVNLLCRAIGSIGARAAAAVPELAAIVERRTGPSGLKGLAYGSGPHIGPLPDTSYVAVSAARALGAIGPGASAALPALRRAALSADLRIADAAELAIRAIR